jgi:hypothetical protein
MDAIILRLDDQALPVRTRFVFELFLNSEDASGLIGLEIKGFDRA